MVKWKNDLVLFVFLINWQIVLRNINKVRDLEILVELE